MGHQIGFYMAGRDEAPFLEFALHEQGLFLFHGLSESEENAPIERESLRAPGEPGWRNYYLVPRGRVTEVRYGKVPLRDYFALDMASPAIRFARAGVSPQRLLVRGMLYLNSDPPRPHELELTYRRLEAWLRRRFRRAPADRVWAGPEAWAWLMKWGPRPARP